MKSISSTSHPGIYIIETISSFDERGFFTKPFSENIKEKFPFDFKIAESFTTSSNKNVIRGMHFQKGFSSHRKIVSCINGSALDVIVDIRKESPYFNKPFQFKLESSKPFSLLIDKYYAHGFLSMEHNTIIQYFTTTPHNKDNDVGVLWKSINFEWPVLEPTLSKRDLNHPTIQNNKYQ